MKTEKISELTTNRLSVYLRCLNELETAGIATISSQALAKQFNLNSAQIRKDLAYFGEFGVRGVGYFVKELRRHLLEILGLNEKRRIALVGAGNLGLALANYQGFKRDTFCIVALFDDDPQKVGTQTPSDLPIHSTEQLAGIIEREEIDIVIIAVPAPAAQQVLDRVTAAGIKAVLNFAPVVLNPKAGVKVKNVDLSVSLESLSYFLAHPSNEAITVNHLDLFRVEPLESGKSA
ncbi:MAG: redox-sensing transcriptional repressor Rex [Acidobacteria bacterium]|nr:redox-sensing transcriptional repressor Rex [Acidobacteriota bacterium]MBI3424402.1 redox-sensing transcriptional repressor Rex [Acidobacteriota bacterium]